MSTLKHPKLLRFYTIVTDHKTQTLEFVGNYLEVDFIGDFNVHTKKFNIGFKTGTASKNHDKVVSAVSIYIQNKYGAGIPNPNPKSRQDNNNLKKI